MNKLAVAIVAASSIVRCGDFNKRHASECELRIDPAFLAEEYTAIIDSVHELETAMNGAVKFNPIISSDLYAPGVHSVHRYEGENLIDSKYLGLGWVTRIDLIPAEQHTFKDCGSNRSFHTTAMHELVHHVGVSHLEDSSSLMYKVSPCEEPMPCIDTTTVEALCGLYDCSKYDIKPTCEVFSI